MYMHVSNISFFAYVLYFPYFHNFPCIRDIPYCPYFPYMTIQDHTRIYGTLQNLYKLKQSQVSVNLSVYEFALIEMLPHIKTESQKKRHFCVYKVWMATKLCQSLDANNHCFFGFIVLKMIIFLTCIFKENLDVTTTTYLP